MKNPHGVKPTKFKSKNEKCVIYCNPKYGPLFSDRSIEIGDNCNREYSCSTENNGKGRYECNPEYKSSLFVNTAGPNEENEFSVLDYEVFTYECFVTKSI